MDDSGSGPPAPLRGDSRRAFLRRAGLGALAAPALTEIANLWEVSAGEPQATPRAGERLVAGPRPEMRIDVHAHAFPESFLRRMAAEYPDDVRLREPTGSMPLLAIWASAPLPAFDPARRIREMDRDDVAVEVLSAPPVYQRIDGRTAELCSAINDAQLEIARAHPDRFRSFVHLPVHDPGAAEKELARRVGNAEVAGVSLATNMAGVYPGDPAMTPVWDAIVSADLPVFLHPVTPCGACNPLAPVIFDFPNDTALAAGTMIYSGLFERHPGLKVILCHYGGALPSLARRLDMVRHPHFPPGPGAGLPALPSESVRRFFVDTAQGFHRPGFDCARSVFGLGHMLYGSDHFLHESPWRPDLNAFLDGLPLSREERAALLRGNAERLLA